MLAIDLIELCVVLLPIGSHTGYWPQYYYTSLTSKSIRNFYVFLVKKIVFYILRLYISLSIVGMNLANDNQSTKSTCKTKQTQ